MELDLHTGPLWWTSPNAPLLLLAGIFLWSCLALCPRRTCVTITCPTGLELPGDSFRSRVLQLGRAPQSSSDSLLPPPFLTRRESVCCGVWLQVHRDLSGRPAQCEGAVWGDRAAGAPPARQQGEEREAAGLPEKEGEHPQESPALLGQDCGQKQQEYGFQAQVQILPWPLCALGPQSHPRCSPDGHRRAPLGLIIYIRLHLQCY